PGASAELESAARDAAAAAQAAAGERARLQVEAEERWARVAAIERSAQAELAAELDAILTRRADTESTLTGGSRDALLALRGAAQRLGVRHESAQRLLAEARHELEEVRRAPSGPSPAELGRAADEADAAARAAVREHEDLEARVRLPRRASSSRCSCSRSKPAASARPPRRSAIAPRPCSRRTRSAASSSSTRRAPPASAPCSCSSAATRATSSTCRSSRARSCSPRACLP